MEPGLRRESRVGGFPVPSPSTYTEPRRSLPAGLWGIAAAWQGSALRRCRIRAAAEMRKRGAWAGWVVGVLPTGLGALPLRRPGPPRHSRQPQVALGDVLSSGPGKRSSKQSLGLALSDEFILVLELY